MARSPKKTRSFSNSLSMAQPKGQSVTEVQKAESGYDRVVADTSNDTKPAKVQRNREGMKKTTQHMSEEARDNLKLFVLMQKRGLEEWCLEAFNEKLEKEKADFRIG